MRTKRIRRTIQAGWKVLMILHNYYSPGHIVGGYYFNGYSGTYTEYRWVRTPEVWLEDFVCLCQRTARVLHPNVIYRWSRLRWRATT